MAVSFVLDATLLWVLTFVAAILASIFEPDSTILNFIFVLVATVTWLVITLHVGPYWLQDVAFGILIVVFIFQLLVLVSIFT